MTKYRHYDSDNDGFVDYDIAGKEYIELLEACFEFCASVSIRIRDKTVHLPDELEKYRIPLTQEVVMQYRHYYREFSVEANKELRHYRICNESRELLLGITDSIFKWISAWGYQNPEDPAFFRADGSVFFSSVIHEGECTLYPRDDEDVSSIVSKGHWILIEK